MRVRPLSRIAVCLLASLWACPAMAAYQQINEVNPEDPMQVKIYKLDNGLTVYLSENHQEPKFHASIAVRVGAKNDPRDATGLAHYLEHLMFKGTSAIGTVDWEKEKACIDRVSALYDEHFKEQDPEKRKAIYQEINKVSQEAAQYAAPNELDRLFNAMGSTYLNAHTSFDEVVYEVTLPSNRLEQWATVETERFMRPVFRLFHTELETVYEEKNRALDNKDYVTYIKTLSMLYKNHPYGQSDVLGHPEHLKAPRVSTIVDQYLKYHVPGNMAIAISGDIDIEATMALVDKHFGVWENREIPPWMEVKEEPLQGREFAEIAFPGEPFVGIAFRTAPKNHPDSDALAVMDMALSNQVAGLIDLNLVQAQKMRSATATPLTMNDYGAQWLYGVPAGGETLEQAEALLMEQVALLKQGAFDDWVIPAIVTDLTKNVKQSYEDNKGRATAMADAFTQHEDWDHHVALLARLAKITKEDVVRVAEKYLGENRAVLYRRDGKNEVAKLEKPPIDPVQIDPSRVSVFTRDLLSAEVSPIEPVFLKEGVDFQREPGDGMEVIHVKNPFNDLFALEVVINFGHRQDARLSPALNLLEKAGTQSLSPVDVSKEWYKLGASFHPSGEDQRVTLKLSGLDANFEASCRLAFECMRHPAASQELLDQLVQNLLARREDMRKDPQTLNSAASGFARLGEKAPYRIEMSSEAMKALKVEDLLPFITKLLDYECSISYAGSLPLQQVMDTLSRLAAEYELPAARLAPPPYERLSLREAPANTIFFLNQETAQAQIMLHTGSAAYDEANRPVSDIFNECIGGMSGAVFQELREARGLAYAAQATYRYGARLGDQDLLLGYIGTQPDKTIEAVSAFLEILDNPPASPERFAMAKDALISQCRTDRIGFRDRAGVIRSWEDKGLTNGDPRVIRYERLQQATPESITAFHAACLTDKPKIISIVGDKNRMDMDALGKLGAVTPVTLDDLFVK